jgi:outer membrane protein assembly complex protein YaeT
VEPLTDPRLQVAANVRLDLAALSPLLLREPGITGTLASRLEITGAMDAPVVRGTLNGSGISALGEEGSLTSTVFYEAAASRMRATAVRVQSTLGTAEGSADIALETGRSSVELRVASANLARWSRPLKLPVNLASAAQAEIRAEWPALDYEQAKATAVVQLKASEATARKHTIPVEGTLHARLDRGTILAEARPLSALGVQVNGAVSLGQRGQIAGELTVTAENLAEVGRQATASALLPPPPEIGGAVTLRAALSGTVKQPEATIVMDAPALRWGMIEGGAARAETSYRGGRLELTSASLAWAGHTAHLRGAIDLNPTQPTLQIGAELRDGSLPLLMKGLRQDLPVSGVWSAVASASGPLRSPEVRLHAAAQDLTAYGERLGSLSLDAAFTGHVVELRNLTLQQAAGGSAAGTLQARGAYDIGSTGYNVHVKGDRLSFESLTLPGRTAVRGLLDFEASGSGTIADPGFHSTLRAAGLQIDQYELGDVDAAVEVASMRASIEAAAPRFQARLTGSTAIQAPHATQFDLSVQGLDIASLPLKFDPPLAGVVDASLHGEGEPEKWKDGALRASITRSEINLRGQTLRNDGPLEASVQNRRLTLSPATVRMGDSRLSIEGSLPLDAAGSPGSVRLDGDLNIETVQAVAALDGDYQAAGRVRLQGMISGTAQAIVPDLDLVWQDGRIVSAQWKTLQIDELRASVRGGAIRIAKAAASWEGAKLQADASIPLALLPGQLPFSHSGAQTATLTATLDNLDLRAIPGMPAALGGTVALEAVAEASALRLDALKARIKATTLRMQADRYTLDQQGESAVLIENGLARIERAALKGPEMQVALFGTAELKRGGALNVRADSDLDIAILSPFAANTRMQGPARLRLVAFGALDQPKLAGFFEMNDGRMSLAPPGLSAEHLSLRAEFAGDRFELRDLRGDVNGGRLRGAGHLRYAGGSLTDVRLSLNGSNIYLNYPFGLKTVSGGELTLQDRGNQLLLGGNWDILEGSYTDPITLETGLFQYFQSRPAAAGEEGGEQDSLLSRLLFNVAVQTRNPVVLDNNLAKAELTANLRLTGSYRNPGLTGRIEVEDGGRLFVAERNYLIERGVVTFTSERKIEPSLDIAARTKVSRHDITMLIQGGGAGRITTALSSDTQLSEEDIASLLVTGRTLEDARGAGSNVAREQALSLLAGSIGGTLSSQVRRATGISQFRVEPGLIAPESNPTARLTVGQDLAKGLSLVYSMNLTDSRDQIYVAQWEIYRRFVTRGVRQSDASFRFEFNHDIRLGGPPAPRSNAERMQRVVRNVRLTGTPLLPEKDVLAKLGAKPGRKYDFFALRNGVDRLEKQYAKRGLLESSVRLTREIEPGSVDLNVNVSPGPAVSFAYEGWDAPGSVRDEVKKAWQRGVFDAQRTDDAVRILRTRLVDDGYLQAAVTPKVSLPSDGEKRVLFQVEPGTRYGAVQLRFEPAAGNGAPARDRAGAVAPDHSPAPQLPAVTAIPAKELERVIEKQRLRTALLTDPARVAAALTAHYRAQGYFEADVSAPQLQFDPARGIAQAIIRIAEGPVAKVGAIAFQGNRAFEEKSLLAALPVVVDSEWTPALREQSLERIRSLYESKGYNDAVIQTALRKEDGSGRLRVEFQIEEGRQSTVTEIRVAGNSRVSEGLIRSQLPVKPGDPLVVDQLSRARRDLYGTGAFSLVEIDREEMETTGATKPVRLTIRVRETSPWDLRYGGYFDTERGPGGITDISNRNSLGSARVLGFRGRYDSDLREGRIYFAQPLLRRFPVKTVATTFFRRELQPAFRTDRMGFSVQEESRFRGHYLISFGYRLERAETVDRMPDPIFGQLEPIITRITPLTATVARDTRDDILDATRGSLMSHAIEYAPEFLGSQLRYAKYFGQYFKFVPLTKPAEVPFQGGLLRPRFIYAGGVRAGFAAGLGGQILIPSERFFAGGGTTIRGFAQNTVGPAGFNGDPRGGNAVFVVNNEIRFPIYGILEGVGFSDIGNVYRNASDFALSDLRKSGGFGLRIRTPYFLLRLDYGFKLGRRPGEGPGRLFFSIGQAF